MDAHLLEAGEEIFLFDSQLRNSVSGNFISDKRIASYWMDERPEKKSADFAFYPDIDTLIANDMKGALTYAAYIEVVKKDSANSFKVYVDGDSAEVRTFFERAFTEWRKRR